MIDGIGFAVYGNAANELWDNPLLQSKEKKEHDGLYFKKTDKCVYVSGSLHRFKNCGLHNCDNFTYSDLLYVLNRIRIEYKLNPDIIEFNGLEFGLNIQLPFDVKRFLQAVILYRDSNTKPVESEMHGKRVCFQDFEIKMYNKSAQSPKYSQPNTLRFEVVIKRSERVRKQLIDGNTTTVRTLSDLANIEVWKDLHREILRCFDALIVYDIDVSELKKDFKISDKDVKLLNDGKSFEYWKQLSKMAKKRQFDRFVRLIDENSSGMKYEVRKMICDKIEYVVDTKKVTRYTENVTKHTVFHNTDSEQLATGDVTKYNVDKVAFGNMPFSRNGNDVLPKKIEGETIKRKANKIKLSVSRVNIDDVYLLDCVMIIFLILLCVLMLEIIINSCIFRAIFILK